MPTQEEREAFKAKLEILNGYEEAIRRGIFDSTSPDWQDYQDTIAWCKANFHKDYLDLFM